VAMMAFKRRLTDRRSSIVALRLDMHRCFLMGQWLKVE